MDKNEKWLWSGKMLDCNGRVSNFNLGEDSNGSSPFLLQIYERDGVPTDVRGTLKLSSEGKQTTIRFEGKSEKNDNQKFNWVANLKPANAARYAKASMFGTYEGESDNAVLSNGVIIMWQFS